MSLKTDEIKRSLAELGSLQKRLENFAIENPSREIDDIQFGIKTNLKNLETWIEMLYKFNGKYTLRFAGESSGEPILSKVAKIFDIDFNILAAGIEKLPDCQVGTMLVDIVGEKSEIERAVAFLNENNVSVQEETSGGENK